VWRESKDRWQEVPRKESKRIRSDIHPRVTIVTARQDASHPLTDRACGRAGTVVASSGRLPHAKLHRVLTKEDDHGNLCRAGEVH
jgi:hypothetical protein